MSYGNKIRDLRKQKGLSQIDMEVITGTPQSTISMIERSEFGDLEYICKALDHWGIPRFEFFARDEDLKNYIPSWMTASDLYVIRFINGLERDNQDFIKETINRLLEFIARYVGKDFQKLDKT